ncbi:TetR/AcrR family transcriptional regulator [Kibdelosporangium phytohabitans]|uniref:TetR family transcriptional regulator n=1 Tax=Kibdelosporangium phytohabitans TaxID=860235 RepID=A0A0N9IJT4_9PSEU|nr:TetR/AcrR family transcriptional regulator [Kibdelosporangium phytohabitans]ALG15312.1 TetR family transcriptional regulator [Kibdelosporangium phytohabitans]MBE1462855.1 AcrR family transcriptional regulator [Kibdelosporangium phytohabitans]
MSTRDRILQVTSQLMQRQGYEGTAIKQIAKEAQVALSSVYHFFPNGKQELATDAVRHADAHFAGMLTEALASQDDPADAIIALARVVADHLRDSDWQDGCPITATALETAGRIPEIQAAAEQAFERWRGLVAEKLRPSGIPEQDVKDLAYTVINTLDGAELAATVSRNTEPLEIAGRHLARLINSYR